MRSWKGYGTARWKAVARAAKTRDGFRCVKCGTMRNTRVHHVVPVDQGGPQYSIANAETLCESCHRHEHYADDRRRSQGPLAAAWERLASERIPMRHRRETHVAHQTGA